MDRTSRSGFALPVAVFAMVVVGVLVTGGFYLARQQARIGVASKRGTAAFYLAERGVMDVLSEWNVGTFGALPHWGTVAVSGATDDGTWSVDVTRMTNRLYFLHSTGTVSDGQAVLGQASRSVGTVARLNTVLLDPKAALTTVGELTVGGNSRVLGSDSVPSNPAGADWSSYCDLPLPPRPGVLIDSLANIAYEGKAHIIQGEPEPGVVEDNTLTADSLLLFGDDRWDDLVALADKIYPNGQYVRQMHRDSVLAGGSYVCSTADNWAVPRFNWGDPFNPGGACGSYFPVIYASGDLFVEASSRGQGILLVEGNLTFKGGFQFFGPVIVRGTVVTEGTGGHFNGGLIAANVSLTTTSVLGDAKIQYSSCAVSRAVLNSALTRARPLERRSWVDMSSVTGG